ncbi:hypothetical protein Salat_2984600 [Sesamum alatum]|uniref:Uncharacterized protein n=1 Tax=Sesamum alatum TaxID=300844 RepID=A0AAE1XI56_9LAMI|nr:hypothetical protein Salat_2984600 [Sesamum alatum]
MATPAYRSIYPEERKDRILTYWYKLNFRASGFSSKEFQLKHRLLLEVWIRFLTVMGSAFAAGDWSLTGATIGGCSALTESTGSTVEGGFVGIKVLKAKSMEGGARKKDSLIHRQARAKLDEK